MHAETALSLLIPVVILAVLWTLVRHWVLPFVLGFALAVALGPSARPLMAGAWEVIANAGRVVFGSPRAEREDPRERPTGDRYERDVPETRDRGLGERRRGPQEGYEQWPEGERR